MVPQDPIETFPPCPSIYAPWLPTASPESWIARQALVQSVGSVAIARPHWRVLGGFTVLGGCFATMAQGVMLILGL